MEEIVFNREKLLSKGKGAKFCATPTVATYDMGLQYDYVMPEGVGTNLGSMGQWPAYWFSKVENDKWTEIRKALTNSRLTMEILEGTELAEFAQAYISNSYESQFRDIELNQVLSGLLSLPEYSPERIYAICDMGAGVYEDCISKFYDTEEEFLTAFKKEYCRDFTPWDDLENEDLIYWVERLDTDFDSFPYYHYSHEYDDEEVDND